VQFLNYKSFVPCGAEKEKCKMFEAIVYAIEQEKARRAMRRLKQVRTEIVLREINLHLSGICAQLRDEGYQRGVDRIAYHFEHKMKEVGLVAAQAYEDKEAARLTDAHYFVFKIPFSNCESLSMMYAPQGTSIK
jgi:hypothetical protein